MNTGLKNSIERIAERLHLRKRVENKSYSREDRREIIEAVAKATLLSNKHARLKPEVIAKYTDVEFLPSKRRLNEIATFTAVRARIQKGNLKVPPPWNGDFVFGLKVSGALRESKRPYDYHIYMSSVKREEFNKSLELNPFAYIRYGPNFIGAPLLSWYPPETKDGPSIVAGIFGGSFYRRGSLEIKYTSFTQELLDFWTIRYERTGCLLLVSLFYAYLFASYMPKAFAESLLKTTYARDCPMLPAIYWELLFQGKGDRLLPSPSALPFGCSPTILINRGWDRASIYGLARENHILNVYSGLRDLMGRWAGLYKEGKRMSSRAIVERLREENNSQAVH